MRCYGPCVFERGPDLHFERNIEQRRILTLGSRQPPYKPCRIEAESIRGLFRGAAFMNGKLGKRVSEKSEYVWLIAQLWGDNCECH